jgi:aspartate aminotransferase
MASRLERLTGQVTNAASSPNAASSHFADLAVAPPNEIFNTKAAYLADKFPNKVDLGIGAYRTDEAKPYVLPVVRKAELELANDKSLNKEYLAISGMADFVKIAQKLILGDDCPAMKEGRVSGVQSLSGTGALRILCEFIGKHLPKGTRAYLSRPTWENHHSIMVQCGVEPSYYAYWDPKTRGLNINGMLADIENAPNGSVIVLHACAHNPTGVDPTMEQWKQILAVIKRKNHVAFFDSAYQGFASGDLARDSVCRVYFFLHIDLPLSLLFVSLLEAVLK